MDSDLGTTVNRFVDRDFRIARNKLIGCLLIAASLTSAYLPLNFAFQKESRDQRAYCNSVISRFEDPDQRKYLLTHLQAPGFFESRSCEEVYNHNR